MRRFIEKVFKDSSKEPNFSAPSLPPQLPYLDIFYMTNRGFLAKKLGQYVGLHSDEGAALFYHSFSQLSFDDSNQENQYEYLLYLSEQMLKWNKLKHNIPLQVKNLDVNPDIQNALLKAYEMHKTDLFSMSYEAAVHDNKVDSNTQMDPKWVIYRDVIFAATQEKFLLISEEEVNTYRQGTVFCKGMIKNRSDIPECRNLAKQSLESENVSKSTIMSWLLLLSEAITNTIKHAEEGKMTLIKDEKNHEIRFIIEDNGPGFNLEDLPRTTLLAGYSTKKSMGQGFTLMMKMSKQVLLYTSSRGSTLILTFDISKEKEGELNATG
ncbi:ATP-binding protein [Domibacillus epiphyticus]|uniref:ATP-binding protein n=1 Tax=Domibacillus epiphyticus TaxID=1714355 RepID=A0A1V2A920_9BACI|nr:ATP-binding protein [Domibacillus epiphyticus]OMP67505.1 ATP-binding protein [Domibacillus epiphyticus]